MEVLGTPQKYLKANEVKTLVAAYAKKLLVSIVCQFKEGAVLWISEGLGVQQIVHSRQCGDKWYHQLTHIGLSGIFTNKLAYLDLGFAG